MNPGQDLLQNFIVHGYILIQQTLFPVIQQIEYDFVSHSVAYMRVCPCKHSIHLFKLRAYARCILPIRIQAIHQSQIPPAKEIIF